MKKHFLILLMVLSLFQFGYSQVPSAIPYQAVVRNGNGNILPNHPVQLRFSIHDSITNGIVLYQETHSISTNGQGLVITNIGQGTSTTGTFSGINWGKNNKFVQTELSINNDNTYTDLGTTQFLSVPYSLHAANGNPDGTAEGEMLYWNGSKWVKVAPGSEGQTLTFCGGKPHWGACPPSPIHFGNGLTDIDGNTYDTVSICNQVWMKQNLNVSRYRNGDIIPQITDAGQWASLTTGAWCWYNNDSANYGAIYGKLYNWYAVNDTRGLAPEGWHVPSDGEWNRLVKCLDINTDTTIIGWLNTNAGGVLKSISSWDSPNTGASNSTGFSLLGAGIRYDVGNFAWFGGASNLWSSDEFNDTRSWFRFINNNTADIYRDGTTKSYGFSVRCVKDNTNTTPITLPTISTDTISSITSSSATSGGNITNDGGGNITARGICWSTSNNPTIDLTTKTTDGTGTGSFTSSITGLSPNTTYYVRAYATNSLGTSYGSEVSFTTQSVNNNTGVGLTDIDGNTYDTIRICNQTWMKKNLNVSRYRNGDIIPQVTDPTQWANLTTGAWCYYNNDSTNGSVYGKLYNWYAVNDSRGLAPEGWHVSTDGEWTTLTDCLGGASVAGGKMKESGTTHWYSPNSGATNSSGFTALPGGILHAMNSSFIEIGNTATWWTSTEFNSALGSLRGVFFNVDSVYKGFGGWKYYGLSVRCVKDEQPPTLNDGLVAYYPFNGNANDESGNGNNGVVNGATLTTDRFGNSGKAFLLQGNTNNITTSNCNPSFNNFSQSISLWIKFPYQWNYSSLSLSKNGTTYTNGFNLAIDQNNSAYGTDNYLVCYIVGNGTAVTFIASQTDLGSWANLTATYDGSFIKLYLNGLLKASQPFSSSMNCPDNNISYSLWDNPTLPNNSSRAIDDIRIYNRALTQEEISYLATH